MAIIKAEGVVLKTMKIGETSKLVTLFTREKGILKLTAKGSRTMKSRFGAALEPLTVIKIVYYHKETREIQFLSQADIIARFPTLQEDLGKLGYACACCELIFRTQPSEEPKPRLYPVLLETFTAMNEVADPVVLFHAFQMKLLRILGLSPTLDRCRNCEKTSTETQTSHSTSWWNFHIAEGRYTCSNCTKHSSALQLTGETLGLLNNFLKSPMNNLLRFKISPTAKIEIENFYRAYFSYHLPELGRLDSLKFIKGIKDTAKES